MSLWLSLKVQIWVSVNFEGTDIGYGPRLVFTVWMEHMFRCSSCLYPLTTICNAIICVQDYSIKHKARPSSSFLTLALLNILMRPILKKWGSILVLACIVCLFKKRKEVYVLKFHIRIPCQKLADTYFCLNYLPLCHYVPFKGLE